MYSSDAPPPVEMCPNCSSAKPRLRTADAESPPPMMENASDSTIASATAFVPPAKGASSKTPTGPFQKIVFAFLIFSAKSSRVFGPISRPSASAPSLPPVRSSTGRISVLASAEKSSAQTTSTAVTISVPFLGASSR